MRHGDKVNNLGRTASHRKALMANMACNLIEHKRIITTLAKAKSLRVYVEPIITRSKQDTTHNRRMVFSYLQSKEAVKELFGVIGDKVSGRPGGYTRIIKLQPRFGDAADMALIELVDFNELYKKGGDEGKKKTRRSRRGGKKAEGTEAVAVATEEVATPSEAPATEEASNTEVSEETPTNSEESTSNTEQSEG